MTGQHIIVIGCGVSGLSCGVRLLELGYSVAIWARDLPPHTTSNIAAAIWYPYKAYPQDKVLKWGKRAFEVFTELSRVEGTGVSIEAGYEVFREPVHDPWWREAVTTFRRAQPDELPPGRGDAYAFDAPVIEMPVYLGWLVGRFTELGGTIEQRAVAALDEPLAAAAIVVNCSGLGSRTLAGDATMYPIRGQIIRIERGTISAFLLDEEEDVSPSAGEEQEESEVAYIVPRAGDCILGGTSQPGNWSLEPDMQTSQNIIEQCARFEPQVRHARILEHLVGLRPGRPTIRLEAETLPNGLVIHNYGHGGAGVTLSWGCAEEVVALITNYHQRRSE